MIVVVTAPLRIPRGGGGGGGGGGCSGEREKRGVGCSGGAVVMVQAQKASTDLDVLDVLFILSSYRSMGAGLRVGENTMSRVHQHVSHLSSSFHGSFCFSLYPSDLLAEWLPLSRHGVPGTQGGIR